MVSDKKISENLVKEIEEKLEKSYHKEHKRHYCKDKLIKLIINRYARSV